MSKWTGKKSPVNLPRGRRDSASINISHFHKGIPVWIENSYEEKSSHYRSTLLPVNYSTRPTWIPGVVQSVDTAKKEVSIRTNYTPPMIVSRTVSEVWPRNRTKGTLDDMVYFHHLHEPAIVNNIMVRYLKHNIYTRAGELLIIMNPYKLIRDKDGVSIYDNIYMKQYRVSSEGTGQGKGGNPPHIFEVANRAFLRMSKEKKPQSIVISGESGAGKTETTKQIMQFVANISSSSADKSKAKLTTKEVAIAKRRSQRRRGSLGGPENKFDIPDRAIIEQQLLQSNPILESFGNAKTMRNNNSSRFGKYLKIFFDGNKIIGGSITNYLLEKSRVFSQLPGERSYHIFYQVLRGTDSEAKQRLGLKAPKDYHTLSKSKSHEVRDAYMGGENSSDEADFNTVLNAMKICGFSPEDQDSILRIVAAVINLGSVKYDEVDDDASTTGTRATGPTSNTKDFFKCAAANLGLDFDKLVKTCAVRHLTVGANTQILPVDGKSADDHVIALAGALYTNLFSGIVKMVNNGIKTSVKTTLGIETDYLNDPNAMFIGILDIFGFEVFDDQNGFEQLLINYANERLHNFFIHYVFKLEEMKYREEGIDYSTVAFTDNQPVIDLISKRTTGLFQQVSSASMFGKLTDVKLLSQLDKQFKRMKNSAKSEKDKKVGSLFKLKGPKRPDRFVISHSANNVEYTINGFLKKNKDHLMDHLKEFLATSTVSLVRKCMDPNATFDTDETKANVVTVKKTATRSTLGGASVMLSLRFGNNISKLMKTMKTTSPLFVRCIKSNEHKRPFYFDNAKVFHQLRYLGVLESIKIRHEGYSYQESFRNFYDYFVGVVHQNPEYGLPLIPDEDADLREMCNKLANILWDWIKEKDFPNTKLSEQFQLGKTQIFIRKKLAQGLEALRDHLLINMENAAKRIQATYAMFKTREKMKLFYRGLYRIQSAWRGIFYREQWLRRKDAISKIQFTAKGYIQRKKYTKVIKPAIIILQRFIKRVSDRLKWLRIRRGLRILHRLSRGFIIRRHVLKLLEAVKIMQSVFRMFIVRNRIYWRKVKAVLYMQSLWRAYRERKKREDIVEFLNLKRKQRVEKACARKIQGFWKMILTYRRYQQIKHANAVLQKWCFSRLTRYRFKAIQRQTKVLQRVARGMIARSKARKLRTANLLADELWRLKVVREREILQLAKLISTPDFKNLGPSKSEILKTNKGKRQTYHAGLLDVDIVTDTSDIYGKGWTAGFILLRDLLKSNNRTVASVAVGAQHSVAIDSLGDVYSWGWGDMGQLGLGSYHNENVPKLIQSFSSSSNAALSRNSRSLASTMVHRPVIRTINCGEDHSVALSEDGSVFTWGSNARGQLGHGPSNRSSCSPRRVETFKRPVVEIGCGAFHNIALLSAGQVAVWGSAEQTGLGVFVGNGDKAYPTILNALTKFRMRHVGSGTDYCVVVSHSGDLYSWGENYSGQLGLGDTKARFVPTLIPSLREDKRHGRIVGISCGHLHVLAQTSTGKLYAWGGNSDGQLGMGDLKDRYVPTRISKLSQHSVVDIAAGGRQSVILTEEHRLFAWGICGAVTYESKVMDYDPDMDNTVFISKKPQEVPFNSGVGRSPRSVTLSYSTFVSVAWMLYHQRPVDKLTAAQPLLSRKTSVAMEAGRMTQNLVRTRIETKRESNEEKRTPTKEPSSPSHGAIPQKDLKKLSPEQLRHLVIELQRETQFQPNNYFQIKPNTRSVSPKHKGKQSRNDNKKNNNNGIPSSSSSPVSLNSTALVAGKHVELGIPIDAANIGYREYTVNTLPVNVAKEKAWDGHFRNSKSILNKGVRVKNHPFTRRMTSELETRTEMLISYSKALKSKKGRQMIPMLTNNGNNNIISHKRGGGTVQLAASIALNGNLNRDVVNNDDDDTVEISEEFLAKLRLQEAKKQLRIEREGKPDEILGLFAPEHLVATSNDEVTLQDIIHEKIKRGQIPTVGLTKKTAYNVPRMENENETIPKSRSPYDARIVYDEKERSPKLTIKKLVGVAGKNNLTQREEMWSKRYDDEKGPKRRDVVESFRRSLERPEQRVFRKASDKAKYKRTNVEWQGRTEEAQSKRRREIENDILGKTGEQHYTNEETEKNEQKGVKTTSKINRSAALRSMSYIALEEEVEALRKNLFNKK
jgi:myosin heavy subunit